jgi:hypothetical protein
MYGLRNQASESHSVEYTDSRISLFSAQRGKCALSGEVFENASDIACWLKIPVGLGGKERYQNMTLIHKKFSALLTGNTQNALRATADSLKATKELMAKVNNLRTQIGLTAID